MSTTAYVSNANTQTIDGTLSQTTAHTALGAARKCAPSVLAILAFVGTALSFGAIAGVMAVPNDVSTILALYDVGAQLPQGLAVLPYAVPAIVLAVLAVAAWRGVRNIAAWFSPAVAAGKEGRAFNSAIAVAVFALFASIVVHAAGVAIAQLNLFVPATAQEAEVVKGLNTVAMFTVPALLLALLVGLVATLKICVGVPIGAATILRKALKWSTLFVGGVVLAPFALVLAIVLLLSVLSTVAALAQVVLFIVFLPFIFLICGAAVR